MMDGKPVHIADVASRALRWVQPRTLTEGYELRADDLTVATLTFRAAFSSLATGESLGGCWTFKRRGFIATQVGVRRCGSEDDIAIFRNNTWSGGGSLHLSDGRTYRANSNFWQTRFEIVTESGSPLVSFTRIGGLLHLSSDVHVHELAVDVPELSWLVMLGWYLTVMQHRDAAVAVG